MHSINKKQIIIYGIVILVFAFFFLPFLIFGTDSIITIHDNLDSSLPVLKMFRDYNYFGKFDTPTNSFNGMSTLYMNFSNYSFHSLLFYIFSDFTAYTISYILSVLFGFISMYLLLKRILNLSSTVCIFSAVCYAVLPVIPNLGICVSTIPLIIYVFYYFAFINKNVFSWKILLILIYPFFSAFAFIGIFLLGFWLLGLIYFLLKNKQFHINLFIGYILLCIGYIIVDLKLFYIMFVLQTPLNRGIFSISTDISIFLKSFYNYGINGFYHAASFQKMVILPVGLIMTIFFLIRFLINVKNESRNLLYNIKNELAKTCKNIKLLFILGFIILFFTFIAALYDSGFLSIFLSKIIPILNGFHFGRVWVFNRILWYLIFSLCLQLILNIQNNTIKINIGNINKTIKFSAVFTGFCVSILFFFQIIYILITPVYYSEHIKTWYNEIIIKTGIANRFKLKNDFSGNISYKEFFALEFFESIKNDISYSNEKVAAFGYHPSVLMYNGFNCIDGYNNAYPLSYMQKFRTLIAPELEINEWAREYYDGWGGRMYLFSSEIFYAPTRNKNTSPVKLNIDMDVFINDFNGKYILSRAEILNSNDLGLNLHKIYYCDESIYTIYLYYTL